MRKTRNDKGLSKWNKQIIISIASKYTYKNDFIKNNSAAYDWAFRNNLMNDVDVVGHMKRPKPVNLKWTLEKIHEVALTYSSRSEFQRKNASAYQSAFKNKWIEIVCSHMLQLGNISKGYIYAYEFNNNHVYVGKTINPKQRDISHRNGYNHKTVSDFSIKNNIEIPEMKLITGLEDSCNLKDLEKSILKKYLNNGWKKVNIAKTGSQGGKVLKWTKEVVFQECLKYNSRSELRKHNGYVDILISKNKWSTPWKSIKKPNGYWTFEKCKQEALKYKTKSEFQVNSSAAHDSAHRNGWLIEIRKHMR